MDGFLDNLNLRPAERRLVFGVLLVVFVVLNVWFVWPHFGDWSKVKADLENAKQTYVKFENEIARRNEYESAKKKLEQSEGGLAPEEMAINLRRNVQTQASQSGIIPNGMNDLPKPQGKSDSLFDETSIRLNFINTGEQELVDFLYNLSAGKSTIRVRDLNVAPDPSQQKLQGDMTLTASYQKKSQSKLAPPAATRGAAPTKTTPPAQPLPNSADVERVNKN